MMLGIPLLGHTISFQTRKWALSCKLARERSPKPSGPLGGVHGVSEPALGSNFPCRSSPHTFHQSIPQVSGGEGRGCLQASTGRTQYVGNVHEVSCFFLRFPAQVESESCSVMSDTLWPWDSPGQNTGVVSLFLLQGIFPTQGLNPGLLHCRWILYHLSREGSPQVELILINSCLF